MVRGRSPSIGGTTLRKRQASKSTPKGPASKTTKRRAMEKRPAARGQAVTGILVSPAESGISVKSATISEPPTTFGRAANLLAGLVLTATAFGALRIANADILLNILGSPNPAEHVFWYGWLTAVSTGLGVVPLLFGKQKWQSARGPAFANAIAAGMMIAASGCLVFEALHAAGGASTPNLRASLSSSHSVAESLDVVDDPQSSGGVTGQTRAATATSSATALALEHMSGLSPAWRVAFGLALGWFFVFLSKKVLDANEQWSHPWAVWYGQGGAQEHEDEEGEEPRPPVSRRNSKVGSASGNSASANSGISGSRNVVVLSAELKRAVLVVAVMFLHSASEGVGLGVSFGADTAHGQVDAHSASHGGHFGAFMSLTLAVHNVPEGLATALVLLPYGVPPLQAALWAVFTSLPQPLLAVPSFLAVQAAAPVLPIGLGFAAGAMTWVALKELMVEAVAEIGREAAGGTAFLAGMAMVGVQMLIK